MILLFLAACVLLLLKKRFTCWVRSDKGELNNVALQLGRRP